MNSILMPESEDFTIDITLSFNGYSDQYFILAQNGSSSVNNRTGIRYYNNQLDFVNIGSSANEVFSGYNPKLMEKVTITIRRNGSNLGIWVNGIRKDEKEMQGLKIYQNNTVLGKWGFSSWYPFNGIIYSVRAYDRALTETEINENYNVDKLRFNM